jgi:hypothetical protein
MKVNRRVGVWIQKQEHRPDEVDLLAKPQVVDTAQPPADWRVFRADRRVRQLEKEAKHSREEFDAAVKAETIRLYKQWIKRPKHVSICGRLMSVKALIKAMPLSWKIEATKESVGG